jgi:hypothetical protein
MLIAYIVASAHAANELAVRAMLKRTSGGDNETELKELTVVPIRAPCLVIVVTTATPVGKRPSAFRKLRCSNAMTQLLPRPSGMHFLQAW